MFLAKEQKLGAGSWAAEHKTDSTTLLVFVNVKSGGNQGLQLLPLFREILPEEQVRDLIAEGGPKEALEQFSEHSGLRILCCGGDGTGKWVLETLDQMELEEIPPVAVLPLGTGNDIARVLGWGGGYAGEGLLGIIDQVLNGTPVQLDRWEVTTQMQSETTDDADKTPSHQVLNNYFSMGFADAKIALDFHNTREESPHLFVSRGVNKLWYVSYGVKNSVMGAFSHDNVADLLSITVDDRTVGLEADLKGIVVLNLPSYAGGMNLWGTEADENYDVVSMNDGLLEVIGIYSPVHLARIASGLASGVRIAQGKHIIIKYEPKDLDISLPCKIDGEPWLQTKSAVFEVTFFKRSTMLCRTNSAASLTRSEKTGWADKLGGKVPSWHRRWFVLQHQRLYYFVTRNDVEWKGCVDVSVAKAYKTSSVMKGHVFAIDTGTGNRVYYLSVDTEIELESWVNALNSQSSRGDEETQHKSGFSAVLPKFGLW